MTLLSGDTGRVVTGTLKSYTITVAAPRETLISAGSEITLPIAEPAAAAPSAISYTVQQSDLPTFSPDPYSVKFSAYLYVSGKNISGGTVTVNYSLYKNGVAVSGATSIAHSGITTNSFWTHSHYRFFDVVVGDVLEARVWASVSTGVYIDYYALSILPTRIEVTKSKIVQDLTYTLSNVALVLGTPNVAVGANWNVYPSSSATSSLAVASGVPVPALCINSNVNSVGFAGKLANGDVGTSTGPQTHATNHPYYYRNLYPSNITFREVLR